MLKLLELSFNTSYAALQLLFALPLKLTKSENNFKATFVVAPKLYLLMNTSKIY